MTGQVKEEIVARFGELGVLVKGGAVEFEPALLRPCEFVAVPQPFRYLDVSGAWQVLTVPAHGLAFTWCQVPLLYRVDESVKSNLSVYWESGEHQVLPALSLPTEVAQQLFQRSGRIQRIELVLTSRQLFSEEGYD
jgi:hypothetical protein